MIGIRREDKNTWEARVPLVPQDLQGLIAQHNVQFQVQRSDRRAFPGTAFARVGATLVEQFEDCPIVLGVKEIPKEQFQPNCTYMFFSHTIKGQQANMPMLKALMDHHCQLIDYERIVDEEGRRLVFFGRFAGLAGMIDTLWALGQRWKAMGFETPFATLQQAYQYDNLDQAKSAVLMVGDYIRAGKLPDACQPLVCGFAGYGQVSQGAQEIFDLLPLVEVSPAELSSIHAGTNECYKVVFKEEDMVERADGSDAFDLMEYYKQPERYRGIFAHYLPYLSVLVNGIYWDTQYPRLVTREVLADLYSQQNTPRLTVIGDISCDIEGSVECTVKATEPDNPVYMYEPAKNEIRDGFEGVGPAILAVDNLPCELPIDSSIVFSQSLRPFIAMLDRADFTGDIAGSGLPEELKRATILWHGELTDPFRYMQKFV